MSAPERYRDISILLVEDNDTDAELVERGLRKHKILNPIVRARDGEEALARMRQDGTLADTFIVLLDINMPRMNGHEFLAEVRAAPDLRSTVVFVLTGSSDESDIQRSYDLNVAGYIVKDHAGPDFLAVCDMLDHYWRVVTLPSGSSRG